MKRILLLAALAGLFLTAGCEHEHHHHYGGSYDGYHHGYGYEHDWGPNHEYWEHH